MSCADELPHRLHTISATPLDDLAKYLHRGSRADEVGRADLHGAGTGQHQFDGAPAICHTTDADNCQVRMRFVHVEDRSNSNRVDRLTAEATATDAEHWPAR